MRKRVIIAVLIALALAGSFYAGRISSVAPGSPFGSAYGSAIYNCDGGKTITAFYRGASEVVLVLSDGRGFILSQGAVAASYPGMPPYYVDTKNTVMFGATKDGPFSLDERTGVDFHKTYSNCRLLTE